MLMRLTKECTVSRHNAFIPEVMCSMLVLTNTLLTVDRFSGRVSAGFAFGYKSLCPFPLRLIALFRASNMDPKCVLTACGQEFHLFFGERYAFSNFHHTAFIYDGQHWPNSEMAYQHAKLMFFGQDAEAATWTSPEKHNESPKYYKRRGREVEAESNEKKFQWDSIKIGIMRKIVKAKVLESTDIQQILLRTGTGIIVEAAPFDYFWGGLITLQTPAKYQEMA
jgi:ribA/ribD-fused uncharacterized protein